jgi:2-keto-4-pentenoate hydratase
MSMRDRESILADLALELFDAEQSGARIDRLSDRVPDLSIEEAYRIAGQNVQRRPGPTVGYKLGYTSAAMRQQMNIAHPNYGVLVEQQIVGPGVGVLSLAGLVHPRVEPELTVRLAHDLRGAGWTGASVKPAVGSVYPSLEIVDTRYKAYEFKAVDNIADNSSSARCVLGAPLSPDAAGLLGACGVELRIDDQVMANGTGADAMGDPLEAVAWLANTLARSGRYLKSGELVMTGGLTRAFEIRAGQHVSARFSGFEVLDVRCA